LRKLIRESLSEEFEELKLGSKDVIITVSNLSTNEAEYKSIKDFELLSFAIGFGYRCNYLPFMSLVNKTVLIMEMEASQFSPN
jgi:hypothetical protein